MLTFLGSDTVPVALAVNSACFLIIPFRITDPRKSKSAGFYFSLALWLRSDIIRQSGTLQRDLDSRLTTRRNEREKSKGVQRGHGIDANLLNPPSEELKNIPLGEVRAFNFVEANATMQISRL